MQARWLLVPGRARCRAELAAQARPYGLFFGPGRHGTEDGPTGHDPTRHYVALSPPPSPEVHGAAAVRMSSQIRARSPPPPGSARWEFTTASTTQSRRRLSRLCACAGIVTEGSAHWEFTAASTEGSAS
jgi:hypothetical protein